MKEIEKLTIVAPWGLSHYISLNGFRPLYRPLFDHISENIEINSLDNVKLHKKLSNDSESLKSILSEIEKEKLNHEKTSLTSLKEAYQNYFCGPNRVLTEKLPGDIEFHHTIPFPSMSRPFVFHCESFPPTNLPFMKDGCSQNKELKEYYKYIFSHDYCLGIFTHIPETLEKIKSLFDDPVITKKLYSSKIGLSKKHYDNVDPSTKSPISNPTLLFINSDYQNPEGFIKRGGHLVLRFWKKFIKSGKTGLLILRSAPPSIKELKALSVDTEFVKSEFGKSIIWFKGYLNNYEINRLVLRSNFLIQPNSLLHSVHTMQAMRLGTVPVVSDMPGADTYISNGKNGIILEGLNPALENQDTKSGISSCDAAKISDTNDKLLSQMTYEIFTLLENKDMYQTTSNQAIKTAISQFSGENFSTNFWNKVTELYMEKNYQPVPISAENDNLLDNCLIDKDNWDRFFESPSQPVQKIHTGKNTVYEFGGSFVQTFGKHEMNPNNWSVLSQYLTDTKIGFSLSPSDLEGKYIYKH
ncbi:MAG: glycosyltransferase, partial [Lentisphaerae bacterium]|nr:glycosyltransferase [Lentisphaerota bacterium]